MNYKELLAICEMLWHHLYYERHSSGGETARIDRNVPKEVADKIWNMKKEK